MRRPTEFCLPPDGTTPIATAHLRRVTGGGAASTLSFQHLRHCHPDEKALRACISAANEFIFPFHSSTISATTTKKNNTSKNGTSTKYGTSTRTKRRPRSARPDYHRDISPSLTSLVTSSSSNQETAATSSTSSSKSAPRKGRRTLRNRFRFSAPVSSSRRGWENEDIDTSNQSRKAHTFAITHPDGSRQYCFCKLITRNDVLILITNSPLAAFYTDVLERTAAVFFDTQPMLRDYNTPASVAAACCVRSLLDNTTSEWLTAYAHSLASLPTSPPIDDITDEDRLTPTVSFDSSVSPVNTPSFSSSFHPLSNCISPSIAASLHPLADPSAILSIPPRLISCVLAALMDERRVAIVGSCIATVSRVVLALGAMLAPFVWPHLLSPVLPRKHAAVLGTPFAYLVGVDQITLSEAKETPLDGVLLVHIDENRLEQVGDDFQMVFRTIPRLARVKLEQRLVRARHAPNTAVFAATVERAMQHFFADILYTPHGTTDNARRHRSFGMRKNGRYGTRTGSWTGKETSRGGEDERDRLATRFKRTQMYQIWAHQRKDDGDVKYRRDRCANGGTAEDVAPNTWTNWASMKKPLNLRQSVPVRI